MIFIITSVIYSWPGLPRSEYIDADELNILITYKIATVAEFYKCLRFPKLFSFDDMERTMQHKS